MPELPEVETTRLGIKPALDGQSIQKIIIREPRLRWPVPDILSTLRNTKIESITRRAKYILLKTEKGTIILHLGMSGRLCVVEPGTKTEKHDHVDIILSNGKLLRYTDPRRFGSILWTDEDPALHSLLATLGPEPLSNSFNAKYLYLALKRRNIEIKKMLMDQKIVVGVGNIYANEALFISGILPHRSSRTLTLSECATLVSTTKTILKKAIKLGGTTLKDFFSGEGKPGYFKQKLKVYGREGEPCIECQQTLLGILIGQRATVYCSSCQK